MEIPSQDVCLKRALRLYLQQVGTSTNSASFAAILDRTLQCLSFEFEVLSLLISHKSSRSRRDVRCYDSKRHYDVHVVLRVARCVASRHPLYPQITAFIFFQVFKVFLHNVEMWRLEVFCFVLVFWCDQRVPRNFFQVFVFRTTFFIPFYGDGKKYHTSMYCHTCWVSIERNCIFRNPALAGVSFSSRDSDGWSCPYRRSPLLLRQPKLPLRCIRMREYVDPTWPLGVRCSGDSHPEPRHSG